jgi:hypothetical protein
MHLDIYRNIVSGLFFQKEYSQQIILNTVKGLWRTTHVTSTENIFFHYNEIQYKVYRMKGSLVWRIWILIP